MAINALLRVLVDPALVSHHQRVVSSIMYIFQSLNLTCVPYLPKVMPVLFHVARTGDDDLREFVFQQLTLLVAVIKGYVRKYLDDLLVLINEFWGRCAGTGGIEPK